MKEGSILESKVGAVVPVSFDGGGARGGRSEYCELIPGSNMVSLRIREIDGEDCSEGEVGGRRKCLRFVREPGVERG